MNKMFKKLPQLTWKDFSTYRGELYGISALWILFFHSYISGVYFHSGNPVGKALIILQRHGNMGVEIFFFLSGASLYGAWQHCSGKLWEFYKKRLIRVLVPTWLVWGGYWIVCQQRHPNWWKTITRFGLVQFWTDGAQGVWFVSMILVFYLVYPFLYRWFDCEEKKRRIRLILAMLVSIGWCFLSEKMFPGIWEEWNIGYTRIPVFLLGSYYGKELKGDKKLSRWLVPGCIAAGLFIIWILGTKQIPLVWERMGYLGALAFMVIFTWMLKLMNLKLFNQFLSFFGAMSLELYLVQVLFVRLYRLSRWYVDGSVVRFFAMLIIDVLVAWLAHLISGWILGIIRKSFG